MDVVEFGTALVETGDLDPIYVMLNRAKLDPSTTKRWCLGYWMFYHAGVASRLAQGPSVAFWSRCHQAQVEKWPRGTERRYYKGDQSLRSIQFLQSTYTLPEHAVDYVSCLTGEATGKKELLREIVRRAQTWVGFGPWIAFKIADMVDAVLNVPVDFTGGEDLFFDDPAVGASCVLMGVTTTGSEVVRDAKVVIKQLSTQAKGSLVREAVNLMASGPLGKLRSPVNPGRLLALQEYETILCKYKSHLNGHYPVGKDTKEILHGLQKEDWGPIGEKLYEALASAAR